MKNNRNSTAFGNSRRRRNPLALPAVVLAVLVVILLAWLYSRGGPQAQQRVEKPIAADKLGL